MSAMCWTGPPVRGGMGAVWLAHRDDGTLKRQVALKLPLGHRSGALAERFARERDIPASLTPRTLRGFTTPVSMLTGSRFLHWNTSLASRLPTYCDAQRLDVRDRLQCFLGGGCRAICARQSGRFIAI